MDKKRIQVYADEALKRRIELAATKHDVPVTAYCLQAILEQLAEDDLLEAEQIAIPLTATQPTDTLIADLRALRAAILAERGGKLINVDDLLEQLREERDYELTGVR
jgi:hypothetical protein